MQPFEPAWIEPGLLEFTRAARFPRLVPGLDFKSSVERVAAFQAGSIPVPRRRCTSDVERRFHLARDLLLGRGWMNSRPTAVPRSVPTATAIPVRSRSLGTSSRRASTSEHVDPNACRSTSVHTADVASRPPPFPLAIGCADRNSLVPSFTGSFRAPGSARLRAKSESRIRPSGDGVIGSGDTVCCFRRRCGRSPVRRSRSFSTASGPSSTASTGRWT